MVLRTGVNVFIARPTQMPSALYTASAGSPTLASDDVPPASDKGCSEYGPYRVLRSIWRYYQLSRCVSRQQPRPLNLSWRLGELDSGCFPVAFPLQISYTTAEGRRDREPERGESLWNDST